PSGLPRKTALIPDPSQISVAEPCRFQRFLRKNRHSRGCDSGMSTGIIIVTSLKNGICGDQNLRMARYYSWIETVRFPFFPSWCRRGFSGGTAGSSLGVIHPFSPARPRGGASLLLERQTACRYHRSGVAVEVARAPPNRPAAADVGALPP